MSQYCIVRCPHSCPAKLRLQPGKPLRCGLCGKRVRIVRGQAVTVPEEGKAA